MNRLSNIFSNSHPKAPKLSAGAAQNACVDAAAKGELSGVKVLLQEGGGATINGKDRYGYTALMAAAQEGHLNVVQYLIKHGADETLTNNCGYTAEGLAKVVANSNCSSEKKGHLDAVIAYFKNPTRPRNTHFPSPDSFGAPAARYK